MPRKALLSNPSDLHQIQYLASFGGPVQWVEVFGSIARGSGGESSDLDVILVVDDETASKWAENVIKRLGYFGRAFSNSDFYDSAKHARLDVAAEILGTVPEAIYLLWYMRNIDIFLFPPDWRDHLDELQRIGRHSDPMFMQNVARDALRYDPETELLLGPVYTVG
ncbi:MAG: nucleotidyltransferase domain-containing protein [Candidatus Saccharimonadaceae bacterium]